MKPTRDPLARLAISAFVVLLGRTAHQSYIHNGRISALEWRLQASEERHLVLNLCQRPELPR